MSQPVKNEHDCPDTGVPVPGCVPVPSGVHSGVHRRYNGLGIALMLFSGVLWFTLFAIPFLPITTGNKALLAGAVFITVQIAWWVGAALAGPQVVRRFKGWMRRRKSDAR